jgi:hypothetical protein
MKNTMSTITRWQDGYMTLSARLEKPVVRFAARASEAIAEYVPERPQWAFLDAVPTMTEFVDSQLKFRRRVVDEQATFVRTMMKAMQPALTKLETNAPASHAVTFKPAAPKASTAKRPAAKRHAVRRSTHKAA